MRTHKKFMEEMKNAHSCEKCNGKIIAIALDPRGNTFCSYCNQVVRYPKATREEIRDWMKK